MGRLWGGLWDEPPVGAEIDQSSMRMEPIEFKCLINVLVCMNMYE